jgi:predicted methyltransferase
VIREKIVTCIKTLIDLGLKNSDTIADIGCSIGYFTIPVSKIVGPEGNFTKQDNL